MKLTILGPNLLTGATFHIHKQGCADLKRAEYRGAQSYNEDWDSLYDIAENYFADQMRENEPGTTWAEPEGYYDEFDVKPCAKDLPEKSRANLIDETERN